MIENFQPKKRRTYSSKELCEGLDITAIQVFANDQRVEAIDLFCKSKEQKFPRRVMIGDINIQTASNPSQQIHLTPTHEIVIKSFEVFTENEIVVTLIINMKMLKEDKELSFIFGQKSDNKPSDQQQKVYYNKFQYQHYVIETEYLNTLLTDVRIEFLPSQDVVYKAETCILGISNSLSIYLESMKMSQEYQDFENHFSGHKSNEKFYNLYKEGKQILIQLEDIRNRIQQNLEDISKNFIVIDNLIKIKFQRIMEILDSKNGQFDLSKLNECNDLKERVIEEIKNIKGIIGTLKNQKKELQDLKFIQKFSDIRSYVGRTEQHYEILNEISKFCSELSVTKAENCDIESKMQIYTQQIKECELDISKIQIKLKDKEQAFSALQAKLQEYKKALSETEINDIQNFKQKFQNRDKELKNELDEITNNYKIRRDELEKQHILALKKIQEVVEDKLTQEVEEQN